MDAVEKQLQGTLESKLVVIQGAAHGYNKEQNEKQVIPEMVAWFVKHLGTKALAQ
jgi:dipeptidyl aminopeptidase/acylaminoacyl peptidase